VLGSIFTVAALSRIPLGIQYAATGKFADVTRTLDMQWAMYLPSIYFFLAYDAYHSTVEANRLFKIEQTQYLKQRYQNPNFPMPIQER